MPYYGQNGFYLPFNNNATTTTLGFDQSGDTTPRVNATVFGDAKISTAQSKFGGASALFDGSVDALQVPAGPNFAYGTGDFTIEGWLYVVGNLPNGGRIVYTQAIFGTNYFVITAASTTTSGTDFRRINFITTLSGGGTPIPSATSASNLEGQWAHFAVVRNSGTVTVYLNGIGGTPTSATLDLSNTTYIPTIGRYAHDTTTQVFNGYIDDLRIYKGVAKYTANFTPPTTAIPLGKSDPLWQYCVLAMPMDGSNNSVVFPAYAANSWTPTNLSVTAGAGNDSMIDVPTTYADGGNGRGNYATWDSLVRDAGTGLYGTVFPSYQDGNLLAIQPNNDSNGGVSRSTIKAFGKFYAEFSRTVTNSSNFASRIGIQYADIQTISGTTINLSTSVYYVSDGTKLVYSSTASSYGAIWTTNDIIGVALDTINGTVEFFKNGASQGIITGVVNTAHYFVITGVSVYSGTGDRFVANFGQRPFAYTPPAGFKALNTANLPESAVKKSNEAFDVVTYTGNGSSFTVNNLSFAPDLVWIKSRSATTDHAIYDTVRGATKDLVSNSNAAETTQTTGLTAFGTNGFTVGSLAKLNTNAATYVAWCWKAGNSTVTNTAGTITSQVRANPTTGFSVVNYTTQASGTATFGHGLGVAPKFMIGKPIALNSSWIVYHSSLGATSRLLLDSTAAAAADTNTWNSTNPTSTVFTHGTGYAGSLNMINYCFAEVPGFSSFGSYTGNGNANGPFVYTGFRPAFVLIKMSSSTGNWVMLDDKRLGYNVDNDPLFANLNNAQATTDLVDFTANGFKIRSTDANVNTNAGTYIYAAFAEIPFKNSLGR